MGRMRRWMSFIMIGLGLLSKAFYGDSIGKEVKFGQGHYCIILCRIE